MPSVFRDTPGDIAAPTRYLVRRHDDVGDTYVAITFRPWLFYPRQRAAAQFLQQRFPFIRHILQSAIFLQCFKEGEQQRMADVAPPDYA